MNEKLYKVFDVQLSQYKDWDCSSKFDIHGWLTEYHQDIEGIEKMSLDDICDSFGWQLIEKL
jgi:hypothetical protein